MSKARVALIDAAFKKLDKTGDGIITVDDMKGVYHADRHPKYISGEKTRDDIFNQFLSNFEMKGHIDGKVWNLPFFDIIQNSILFVHPIVGENAIIWGRFCLQGYVIS